MYSRLTKLSPDHRRLVGALPATDTMTSGKNILAIFFFRSLSMGNHRQLCLNAHQFYYQLGSRAVIVYSLLVKGRYLTAHILITV